MSENETLADIRKESEALFRELLEKHVDGLGHIQAMQQFNQVFDRIEAATQRERGNSAVMRETLEYLLKERDILDFCHNNLSSKTWEDWDKVYKVLRKIIEKAMRALAAPARNCDVYSRKEVRMAYHLHGDGLMTMQAVVDWLYSATKRGDESPRTEQESEVQG